MNKLRIINVGAFLILCFALTLQGIAYGEQFNYYGEDKRDPFVPLVTGQRAVSMGLEFVETIDDLRLEGVIFDPRGESMAILNGEIMSEGDEAYNVKVVKIRETGADIEIYNRVHRIDLVEEGGETVER